MPRGGDRRSGLGVLLLRCTGSIGGSFVVFTSSNVDYALKYRADPFLLLLRIERIILVDFLDCGISSFSFRTSCLHFKT